MNNTIGLAQIPSISDHVRANLQNAQQALDKLREDDSLIDLADHYYSLLYALDKAAYYTDILAESIPQEQFRFTRFMSTTNSFVKLHKGQKCQIIFTQRPPRRKTLDKHQLNPGYYFLQTFLTEHATELLPIRGEATAVFLFIFLPGRGPKRETIDHDNYYMKTHIDVITRALGIPDTGKLLSQTYYSAAADDIAEGLYTIVFSGTEGMAKQEALGIASNCPWNSANKRT